MLCPIARRLLLLNCSLWSHLSTPTPRCSVMTSRRLSFSLAATNLPWSIDSALYFPESPANLWLVGNNNLLSLSRASCYRRHNARTCLCVRSFHLVGPLRPSLRRHARSPRCDFAFDANAPLFCDDCETSIFPALAVPHSTAGSRYSSSMTHITFSLVPHTSPVCGAEKKHHMKPSDPTMPRPVSQTMQPATPCEPPAISCVSPLLNTAQFELVYAFRIHGGAVRQHECDDRCA